MHRPKRITILLASGMFWSVSGQAQSVTTIQPSELRAVFDQRPILLDVRMAGECEGVARVRLSPLNIGFDSTSAGNELVDEMFLETARKNPRLAAARRSGRLVLVLCCQGVRSEWAATILAKQRYRVAHLAGGLENPSAPALLFITKREER